MARIFTLGTLVTRCQQRCDRENDLHISTTEWKGMISTSFAQLYSILVTSGMRYFETEATLSLTAGVAALPSDHLSTIGVDYIVNATTGERRPLAEVMVQERGVFDTQTGSEAYAYALVGSNIKLFPIPPSGQTYKHLYVPQPTDYTGSADATNVDVVTPDGEDFIIWHTAILALAKEEADTSVAERRTEIARQRVEEWASLRALNTPRRRIVDTESIYRDPADYHFWDRW